MLAYLVMEVGIKSDMHTYGGGLGTLAGDTLHTFSDLGLPAVCVTLLYKNGYVSQKITQTGMQLDYGTRWNYRFLTPLDLTVNVEVGNELQRVRAWEYKIRGRRDTPVLFLDTDLPENNDDFRHLCDNLYDGDTSHRLKQELVLGIGGCRMLKELGYDIQTYHMNEGHSAFLIVDLLRDLKHHEAVRRRCVFTTHTPVSSGHDRFPLEEVKEIFSQYQWMDWDSEAQDGEIVPSLIAAKYSRKINAVSFKHKYVAQKFFNGYQIDYITNGVNHKRWISEELQKLYDAHIPGWEIDPSLLRQAYNIPSDELMRAHKASKDELINLVRSRGYHSFTYDAFTICAARRMTGYKRNNLILRKPDKLIDIANHHGEIQIIFAGKAHPKDIFGKEMIKDIHEKQEYVRRKTDKLRIAFLEDYDIDTAKIMVSGCDVWLNTPKRPLEACGTSGMKAGMNGAPNISVWDGWWLEGGIEGVNGWGIGEKTGWDDLSESDDEKDLEEIYGKLSYLILPLFYNRKDDFTDVIKKSIATVGPYFNSHRMVNEYYSKIYAEPSSTVAKPDTTEEG